MNPAIVLVLAAGESKRWAGRPKHLLPIWDGETVLSRILRQVRSRGREAIVVARDPAIFEAAGGLALYPGPTPSVFQSMLATRRLWGIWTTMLLGDVVFTDETLAATLDDNHHGLRIFTNPRETYAISFGFEVEEQVESALAAQAGIAASGGIGSLRGMSELVEPAERVTVTDKTDDVDSPEKYELILARWSKLGMVHL